ncbi:hypothetical protein DB30_06745 [Enhygromyxa salina]|uniref:Uncharacterized protein n=1 Tax=Enhygromyxa salina TaxID=215803 RepID=A0A0C1ZTY6_9BACT|nr:SitI3 family protein [Enhygromyxa salina]KIG14518.1 hypothetical protein DB30_06745 [Enhygromyxa salina]
MALEYDLHVDAVCPANHLEKLLVDAGATKLSDSPATYGGDKILCVVVPPDPRSSSFIAEEFHVEPRVSVYFRLDKFNLDQSQRSLVQYIDRVLVGCAGDAVVVFNGELVVLRRTHDALLIRAESAVSMHGRASLLSAPYAVVDDLV